jgi:hypothetical protein
MVNKHSFCLFVNGLLSEDQDNAARRLIFGAPFHKRSSKQYRREMDDRPGRFDLFKEIIGENDAND